jgi:hypothetical protein
VWRWTLLITLLACARRAPSPWTPPFNCRDGICVQAHPRLPDDGEWECLDMGGASICRGGDPPAGVVPGPPDPRWTCGLRAGGSERICVELHGDLPDQAAPGWRCDYQSSPRPVRRCRRDPTAHGLGDACTPGQPCLDGATCAGGRCVAPQAVPSCWLDGDCPGGACRFGSCRSGP